MKEGEKGVETEEIKRGQEREGIERCAVFCPSEDLGQTIIRG